MIVIYTAIVTPFDEQEEINYDLMGTLINWQAQAGIDGLVVAGTNGEFSSLSFEEVKSLVKFASDHRSGKLEIIAGTGRPSLKETIILCKYMEDIADKVLVVPPFYFKELTSSGLYNYFKRLLEETTIPIILYNIPKYTGVEITVELIQKLKNFENLVGVKDTSGKIESTQAFLKQCPGLQVYAGSDALLYASFEKGASGAICAISNIFPKAMLSVRDHYISADLNAAKVAQEKVLQIRSIFKEFPNRAAIKYGISLLGHPLSYVRPPLINLSEAQKEALKMKLKPFL